MTFQTALPNVAVRIETALVDQLAADPNVRELFGTPARLYAHWPTRAPYPFAVIDRHQQTPLPASGTSSFEHRIDLAVFSRHGGRSEARDCLGALQAAFEAERFSVEGVNTILAHIVYADAMRTQSFAMFRGVLRVRMITEAST